MKRSQILLVSLVIIALGVANAWEPTEHCGPLMQTASGREEIHILCPNLPNLSEEQIWETIVDLLNNASRYKDHNRIFFFIDEPSKEDGFQPASEEARNKRWGNSLIGHYHSRNGVLSLRKSNDQWTEIRLPPDQ